MRCVSSRGFISESKRCFLGCDRNADNKEIYIDGHWHPICTRCFDGRIGHAKKSVDQIRKPADYALRTTPPGRPKGKFVDTLTQDMFA